MSDRFPPSLFPTSGGNGGCLWIALGTIAGYGLIVWGLYATVWR